MSSIDNRIVEMEFDNGKFQKNATTTVDTLADLKKALNFEGAAAGLDEVEKKASRFSLKGIAESVSNAVTNFPILGAVGFTALQRITNAAINTGKSIISSISEPIKQGGWKRAMNLEQAQFQLEGLKQSWEAMKVPILEAVKGTAYGLDEAAKAAAQFAASGIGVDNMLQPLRAISGVAAMTSSSYADISNVFTKVSGQGRVMADDLNRLAARGMNAAATLADSLGMTEKEVRDLVSKGGVSFEMFAKAMDDAFGEHATKANETYTGSLSNMRAALARVGAVDAAAKMVRQRDLFNALTPAIDSVAAAILPMQEAMNNIKAEGMERLISVINGLDFTDLTNAGPHFAGAIKNIYAAVKSYLQPAFDALGKIFGSTSKTGITDFAMSLEDFTAKLIPSTEKMQKVTTVFESIFSVLKAIAGVGTTILSGILSLFGDILAAFFPATDGFEMVTGSVNGFAEAVEKVAGNLKEFIRGSFGVLGDFLSGIASNIGKVLGSVADWGMENIGIGDIFTALVGAGVIQAVSSFTDLLDSVKLGVESLVDIIKKGKEGVGAFSSMLDEVKKALNSFTAGVQVASLLMIASSLLMLSVALKTLSQIDVQKLVPSLAALGTLMVFLTLTLTKFKNILAGWGGSGLIKAGIGLMMLAVALKKMSDAVVTLSAVPIEGLLKGVGSIFAMIMGLTLFIKGAGGEKVFLSTSIALLAMASALGKVADAVGQMGALSWEEIARGLTGMAGALAIFTVIIDKLGKSKGFKAIGGSLAILIAAQALADIADALSSIGELSWDQIGHGLVGIAGTMLILQQVISAIGKAGGLKSILASTGLLIAVQSLKKISDALHDISRLSWEEIGKGILGMAVALGSLRFVIKSLAKAGGLKSILASVGLLIAVQSLEKIGLALKQVGSLSWDEIGQGLAGIAGAFLAIGGITAAVGKLGGFSTIIGAAGILLAVQSLEKIGLAMEQISKLSWDEIARGLTGIAGAFIIIGGLTAVLGTVAPVATILGAGGIYLAVQALGGMADILGSFAKYNWDEIGQGLTGMMGAMAVIAGGSFLNVFSGIGASGLNAMIEPLTKLPTALAKWQNVKVPSDFEDNMAMLASGVRKFIFAFGIDRFASVAESAGVMADSVKKMQGMEVPKDFKDQMDRISDGVKKFILAFGSGNMGKSATSVGQMADAVKKWEGVSVPDSIEEDLTSLANGVKKWNLIFTGGWNLGNATGPIGDLAKAVGLWSNVNVPANMEENLTSLANGVKAWNLIFTGGNNLGNATGPIADLAVAVRAWGGVTVPENMEQSLTSLAEGVKAWNTAFTGGWNMGNATEGIRDLAGAVDAWKNVVVMPDMRLNLENLAEGVKAWNLAFTGGWNMGNATEGIKELAGAVNVWSTVTVPSNMQDDLTQLAEGVKAWSFAGLGSWAMDGSGASLTELASGVKAWSNVTVPPGMEANLSSLAKGVQSWTFAGVGNWSMQGAGENLKELASGVEAWSNVAVPPGMEANLSSLAAGVKSWTFAFVGVWAMGGSGESLKQLASGVKAWNGVVVPPGMENTLTGLANGVKAFGFAFVGSWAAGNSVQPIKDLAGAVRAWSGITINMGIQTQLESLSDGIKSFSWMWGSIGKLKDAVGPIGDLAGAVRKWSGFNIPSNLGSTMSGIADGVKKFKDVKGIDSAAEQITLLSTAVAKLKISSSGVSTSVTVMATAVVTSSSQMQTGFTKMKTAVTTNSTQITTSITNLSSTTKSQMSIFVSSVTSSSTEVVSSFTKMRTGITTAANATATSVRSSISNITNTMKTQLNSSSSAMSSGGYQVGLAMTQGMVRGLNAGSSRVRNAAAAVARSALNSAKATLGVASPSKEGHALGEWFDIGLARGIFAKIGTVTKASSDVASTVLDTISDSLYGSESIFDEELLQPTISPVLDLSNVRSGASSLDSLLASSISSGTGLGYASSIAETMPDGSTVAGGDTKIVNVNFEQTNNSPVALPASDIYRRTNNALSKLEGELV